ncbi:hypothetical protein LTR56_001458 [Elasticomyces elasticus]|nr:hypothetical protein LTR56_001458 [Elasticomyces elasticus]KAK3668619.1 hypothetical protein LTR22_000506 [Elasticomyces elasticus]KAK4931971.1 hypothetical protein LTR49_001658 [Elasticomyces elasticus]KAK5768497.1 hypothetical protein LTS12_001285 [Elasticomyces elasticus]
MPNNLSTSERTSLLGDAYVDLPLDASKKQIRLLHLRPGAGDLQADLAVVDLADQPGYEALSYTWGDRTLDKSIVVGGRYRLPLTDNLWYALRGLRYRWRSRRLWVDALCIDQKNIGERSMQVAFMGEIYNAAQKVCIWLGEPVPKSWLEHIVWPVVGAVGLPRIFAGKYPGMYPRYCDLSFLDRLAFAWLSTYQPLITSALSNTTALWHERAWTVQEQCLAREITWCFGNSELVCHADRLVLNFTSATIGDDKPNLTLNDFASALASRASIRKTLHPEVKDDTGYYGSVSLLMERLRHTKATNPRDKAYSLRGMLLPSLAEQFIPDYRKSCAQVFAEATYNPMAEADSSHNLRFEFSHTVTATLVENLPSWAIDFTYLIQTTFDAVYASHDAPSAIFCTRNDPLPPAELAFDIKTLTLHLTVVMFDKIETSVPAWGYDATGASVGIDWNPRILHNWKDSREKHADILAMLNRLARAHDCATAPRTAYGHVLRRRSLEATKTEQFDDTVRNVQASDAQWLPRSMTTDTYAKTLGGSSMPAAEAAAELALGGSTDTDVDSFKRLLWWWSAYIGLLADTSTVYSTGNKYTVKSKYWDTVGNGHDRYMEYASSSGEGNHGDMDSLFTTTGGFLGRCPVIAQPGNIIALVRGYDLPLMLRPQGKAYILLGYAYVHGILQYELDGFWEDNKVIATKIALI